MRVPTAVALLLAAAGSSASAHHNSVPIYDFSRSLTINGTVTEFRFLNPHARIHLAVADSTGVARVWLAEGANAIALRLNGWTGSEMKPGDRITVTGAPSRDGSPRVEWTEITLADGRVLGGGNSFPKERDELLERLERQRKEQLPAGAP
jgi:hypothetical protein